MQFAAKGDFRAGIFQKGCQSQARFMSGCRPVPAQKLTRGINKYGIESGGYRDLQDGAEVISEEIEDTAEEISDAMEEVGEEVESGRIGKGKRIVADVRVPVPGLQTPM